MGTYVQRPPSVTAFQVNADGSLPAGLQPLVDAGQIVAGDAGGYELVGPYSRQPLSAGDFVYWYQAGSPYRASAEMFTSVWQAA